LMGRLWWWVTELVKLALLFGMLLALTFVFAACCNPILNSFGR
jgi:hypothetical protein